MPAELVVIVHGRAAPQGSKIVMPGGAMREVSRHVGPWREAVRHAAEVAVAAQHYTPHPTNPVAVNVVFTLARPRSHYRTGRNADLLRDTAPRHPATQPDLDKLVRATLDGLADGGALTNDARVVTLYAAKAYAGGHLDALDSPGASVLITPEG